MSEQRPPVRDLSVLLVIAFALSMGLPLLEIYATSGDSLLSIVGSYAYVLAVLAAVVLTTVIVYRLLFHKSALTRFAGSLAAGLLIFFIVFPGSLLLSDSLCEAAGDDCAAVVNN